MRGAALKLGQMLSIQGNFFLLESSQSIISYIESEVFQSRISYARLDPNRVRLKPSGSHKENYSVSWQYFIPYSCNNDNNFFDKIQ